MAQLEMSFWEFVRQSRKFFMDELNEIIKSRTTKYARGDYIAAALTKLNEAFKELEEARVYDHPKKYAKESAPNILPHERNGNPTFFTKVAIATHMARTTEIKAIPMSDDEALKVLLV